ncbi:HIT-like domain [Pseudocohnilembus persalinus]|uniref:HIT-like domain n=1 Tax=Pseudocohnilembus persalinus TaxID=266149 RepID=A0A0V0QVN7_PSEPJ|nr:HIT-like domain [Pseudocohnilembus persalinus]|eukprot:KRX06299.1 HIT-like domain [Pseudocohnilembus persalinus]
MSESKFQQLKNQINDLFNDRAKKVIIFSSIATLLGAAGGFYLYRYQKMKNFPELKMRNQLKKLIKQQQENNPGIISLTIKEQSILEYKNVKFFYLLLDNLAKKPQRSELNPFLPPFENGLYIKELGQTHRLLYNKFQIQEMHCLVVTKNYEKQSAPISEEDFAATLEICRVLKGFAYYNSGEKAGSSQPHKHLQVMPEQSWQQAHLLHQIKKIALKGEKNIPYFKNFKYSLKPLKDLKKKKFGAEEGAYLAQQYIEALKEVNNSDLSYQYNMIFDDTFLLIILRSKEKAYDKIALNAMCFTGSFLVKNQEQLDFIKSFNPIKILEDITREINVELKSVKRSQDEQDKIENTNIKQLSDALSDSQGLLSLLYELKEENNKLKVMICVTAYNEGNDQLELTLQGIKKNLSYFKKQGIDPSEILVTVIFDGISKINDSQNIQEENIFKQTFDPYDFTYKISKKKTMRYQQTQYQKYEKWSELELDQIDSDKELKEMLDKQINENVSQKPSFNSVEDFKLETKRKLQQECIKQGKKYLKQRENSAWIYQDRIPILDEQIEKQQGADLNYNDQNSDDECQDLEEQKINYQNNNRDNQNQNNNLFTVNEQKVKNQIQSVLEKEYLNIMYVAKFKNGQKLNSHLWFFEGFCQLLEPKYVVLIDTGLEPHQKSIFNFFETMELNKNIGGVCGFMAIRTQRVVNDDGQRLDNIDGRLDFVSRFLHKLFNIQKAQQFEYDMAHIIDKAFESLFGFIHVLPGAFSGYRYDAIKNSLKGYLKTELNKKYVSSSLQERNMFLAEDRILCLDLYCTEGYYIQYVPNALAYVDPVINLTVLIGQRRRWDNSQPISQCLFTLYSCL